MLHLFVFYYVPSFFSALNMTIDNKGCVAPGIRNAHMSHNMFAYKLLIHANGKGKLNVHENLLRMYRRT